MDNQHCCCDDDNYVYCSISKQLLKVVTDTVVTTTTTTTVEEKYKVTMSDAIVFNTTISFLPNKTSFDFNELFVKVLAPESMQETFMSDSEDEGGNFNQFEFEFEVSFQRMFLSSIWIASSHLSKNHHYLTSSERPLVLIKIL